MRLIICGDTHIGAVFGLGGPKKEGGNTRVDDYERTFNHIIDYAIETGADAFIQTGDAFEVRNPKSEHMAIINKGIKKLSMANVTSAIIMGNHDYIRAGDGFTSAISSLAAKDYPNVRLVIKPEIVRLHNRGTKGVNIVLLPYRDRRMYEGKTTKDDSLLYQMEVKSLLDKCEADIPLVAIGHNFYHQGSYDDFGGTEILTKIDTFKKCDMVAMGHYHQFKILRKKDPIAIYTGSMEKINFGDEKVDKFFIDYDTVTKKSKIIKCPSRELKDISIDLSKCVHENIISTLQNDIDKYVLKDKITRVKVSIKDKLISFIKKNTIEKMLYDAGSFFVSRVTIEPIFTRVIRDDAILQHKDDFSMFRAFLEDQNMDDEDKKFILAEAKKIIV
jgi:exonuclease SbcD